MRGLLGEAARIPRKASLENRDRHDGFHIVNDEWDLRRGLPEL
jgi:hypothetical protein